MGSQPEPAMETHQSNPNDTQPAPIPQITSLPLIDISSFLDPHSSPSARQLTASSINSACINYGFFYLTGHGIPTSKLDQIIMLARHFFASPLFVKNKIRRREAGSSEGGDGARGYQGIGENLTQGRRDIHEAVDLYREWDHAVKTPGAGGEGTYRTLQGPNLWPAEPEELKDVYLEYIDQLQDVGRALVRAMGVALDLGTPTGEPADKETEDEDVFVRNTDRSFWVMRMIGYPRLETPIEDGLSCGEHTDYGCVTLLLADPTPGALQVLLKDGRTWLPADPIPGAFVVNIGDMIERWTNGLWKSTRHRVVHRGDEYRVSVPFFFEPNFEAVVRPLGKCVERTGGKAVYEGSTYGRHLAAKVDSNF
ncbi:naringenin,2-oxoglutarate 3-dioxygenase [Melanomma pulvis-pyrius CBS 109.77]|uniref:Naringenin,2-oxoglutarate 3-dioxygenase n=1 Tax=Melanomma pulvis-pyrius CBS 109.77 TaxID=1314802 RepID=A0A6A6XQ25_9PLEO|nr:naringenin,2-oxoglutarate 3-dioxygenase [Melanomma pulvis-pyrius CBS 109.77]